MNFMYRHFLRPTKDIYSRYAGKESYVVVTGGSDGIGLEICKQIAELGFNICMISRNKQKMEDKLKQIQEKTQDKTGKKIQTMAIVADFADLYSYADYTRTLEPL